MLVTPLANAYAAAPAAASFDTSAASLFSTGGNDTPENQFYSLTTNNFSNLEVVSSKNIFGADHFANKGNVIDANLGNAATWGYLVGGTAWIEVRANSATGGNAFQPGTYAGFVLGDTNIGVGSQIRVTTYLGDTQQESQIVSGSLLVDLGGGKYKGGFWAAQPFNRVRLTATGILGVGTVSVYYAEVFKPKAGPEPACNVYTNLNQPTYGALIEPSRTGISGVGLGIVSNTDNVVDSNPDNSATLSLNVGVLANASISVASRGDVFPAGYFAGFEISSGSLAQVSLLGNSMVRTYLNGALRETVSANNLFIGAPVLQSSGRIVVGFKTTQSFNEIRYTISQPVGVDVGATQVYNAVVMKFCAGPELQCNTPTSMTMPTYPVIIDGTKTGLDGVACVGCNIQNTENIVNENLNDYASITLLAGIASTAHIAVQDVLTDYPAGTFAGFDIEHPKLIDVNVLSNITVRTYLNNVLQETRTGTGQLIFANTSLLGDDGRRTVGFIASLPFDTVRISVTSFAGADVGVIKVYRAVFQRFCEVNLVCNQTYWLVNPTFPVVIDGPRTGLSGVACVGCSVNNVPAVITPSQADFATITMVAGVLSQGSIAVQDGITTYPAGSTVGFAIQDLNTLAQVDLFETITVKTYLDGALRESKSGGALLDLAALVNWIGIGPGRYNIGFKTSLSFDEVQISVGSLASALNIVRVYAAYVDTRDSAICQGGPVTDLSVVKTASINRIQRGVPFTYSVAVFNAGPNIGQNVLLTDAIPAVLNINGTPTIGCSQGSSASVNVSGHNLSASMSTMNVGETCTVLINVTYP